MKPDPTCFCYIVECADGSFYTGWTTDPEQRIRAHNAGRGARYTKARRPVQLVLLESLANRAEAMKRELAIKKMSRPAKLALIAGGPDCDSAGARATTRRRRREDSLSQ